MTDSWVSIKVMFRSGDAETVGRDSCEKILGRHSVGDCHEKAPRRKQGIASCRLALLMRE